MRLWDTHKWDMANERKRERATENMHIIKREMKTGERKGGRDGGWGFLEGLRKGKTEWWKKRKLSLGKGW